MFNVVLIVETFIAFVIAITIHECAHAATAVVLGDKVASGDRRLSLNPTHQLAPIGTLVAAVLSFAPPLSAVGLGWGRPVRFDSTGLRVGPNIGTILIALAGPLVNLVLGLGIAAGLNLVPGYTGLARLLDRGTCMGNIDAFQGRSLEQCLASTQGAYGAYALRLEQFALILAITSITIAIVNIIPLHPLDGYKVLFALLPSPQAIAFRRWEPYMEAVLLVIFFVVPIILGWIGLRFSPASLFFGLSYNVVLGLAGTPVKLAMAL